MWKFLALLTLCASPAWAELQRVRLDQRFYLIDLPASPSGAMILGLHGAGGTPANLARFTGLAEAALPLGYAVIFPGGSGVDRKLTWNALYCCGQAHREGIDDLAFLDAVVADASARFGLDGSRVYLTGMSNGAMMAETYGALRADRVRAVAGVSGTLDLTQVPAVRLPLLHIHGRDDAVVPYTGGRGRNPGGTAQFTPVADEIAAFVAAFGGLTRTARTVDGAGDRTSALIEDYADTAGQVQVRLISIAGGGHSWPGGDHKRQGHSRDISATEEVLRFFALHP